jgi:hypothetical protein
MFTAYRGLMAELVYCGELEIHYMETYQRFESSLIRGKTNPVSLTNITTQATMCHYLYEKSSTSSMSYPLLWLICRCFFFFPPGEKK